MSRIGKAPIKIEGVTVTLTDRGSKYGGQLVEVKGTKGNLEVHMRPEITVKQEEGQLLLEPKNGNKSTKSYHGLYRTLIANAIDGVTNGYSKTLEIVGIGYKAQLNGNKISLNLGYTVPIVYDVPEGIQIEIKDGIDIIVKGIDKQLVGEVAAQVRQLKKPEPYKGKGIRYAGEHIKIKQGKSAA
jgi:large subunit ribosomal protein L6